MFTSIYSAVSIFISTEETHSWFNQVMGYLINVSLLVNKHWAQWGLCLKRRASF